MQDEPGKEVKISWLEAGRVVDVVMAPTGRNCMTPALLNGLQATMAEIDDSDAEVVVLRSQSQEVFNYGGDLAHFLTLVQSRDRHRLHEYAITCIDLIFWAQTGGRRNVATVAVASGAAFGGGFEAALACDALMAETNAVFAFPEALFGLFPGMGGYALFASVAGTKRAKEACLTGRRYAAHELLKLDVADEVVPAAELSAATTQLVNTRLKSPRCATAIQKMTARYPRVPYAQLMHNTELWIDALMSLTDTDLRKMRRMIRRQQMVSDSQAV